MKSMVVRNPQEPLALEDRAVPEPGRGEVRVRRFGCRLALFRGIEDPVVVRIGISRIGFTWVHHAVVVEVLAEAVPIHQPVVVAVRVVRIGAEVRLDDIRQAVAVRVGQRRSAVIDGG